MNVDFNRVFLLHYNLQVFFFDKLLILVSLLALAISPRKDLIIILTFLLIIPYLIITRRAQLLKPLAVSTLLSLAWMGIAKEMYNYGFGFISIFGINSYSFFSWSLGLFACFVIYLHYEEIFEEKKFYFKLLVFSIFYILLLLFLEWLFYNVLGVRNQMTLSYPPLMICNCIHAPLWMQISYLLLGPLYFCIMKIVKFKNPHYIAKRIAN